MGNEKPDSRQVFLQRLLCAVKGDLKTSRGNRDAVADGIVIGVDSDQIPAPQVLVNLPVEQLRVKGGGAPGHLQGAVQQPVSARLRPVDGHTVIVRVPCFGVGHVEAHGVQLLFGVFLGGLAHPVQRVYSPAEHLQNLPDHPSHFLLDLSRTVGFGVVAVDLQGHHVPGQVVGGFLQGWFPRRPSIKVVEPVELQVQPGGEGGIEPSHQVGGRDGLQQLQILVPASGGKVLQRSGVGDQDVPRLYLINIIALHHCHFCQINLRKQCLELLKGVEVIGVVHVALLLRLPGEGGHFQVVAHQQLGLPFGVLLPQAAEQEKLL